MFNLLNLYFDNHNPKFCNICNKPSKYNSCIGCNELLNKFKSNSVKLPNFFTNSKYWMEGKYNNEKIKSLGLFLLQKHIPINSDEIIKYILKINKYELIDNIHMFYFNIENKKYILKIPNFKEKHNHFVSYDALFLYKEYFNNLQTI
jgi:hypothetical protein